MRNSNLKIGWLALALAALTPALLLSQVSGNQFVTSSYVALLNRNPDPSGWIYWTGIAASSRPSVTNGFLTSAEYAGKTDPLLGSPCSSTTGTFVDCIFEFGLGRAPSGAESSSWSGTVNGGSKYSALESFFPLSEFQSHNASILQYQSAYSTLAAVNLVGQSGTAGTQQTFTFRYTNPLGQANVTYGQIMFAPRSSPGTPTTAPTSWNGCQIEWDRYNDLNLNGPYGNQNGSFGGSATLGVLTQTVCSLSTGSATFLCSGTDCTITLPLTFTSAAAGVTFDIWAHNTSNPQGLGSADLNFGAWTVTSPTPGFSLSSVPSMSLRAGSSTPAVQENINRSSGFNSSVAFTTQGLPAGVTASFSPSSTTSSATTLTLTAASTAARGSFNVTVTGTGGGVTASQTLQATILDTLQQCLNGTDTICPVTAGTYFVTAPIVITRPDVSITGDSPKTTFLVRGPNLVNEMMNVAVGSTLNSSAGGVVISNLTFCGASTHREGDLNNPCPVNGQASDCENESCAAADLLITSTAAPQSWAAPAMAPFTNSGPYNLTISNCYFEDSVNNKPIYFQPNDSGNKVNDVYIMGNTVSKGGVQLSLSSATNFGDYTQCDHWDTVHHTAFADDPGAGPARNIKFEGNTFWVNAGAISGFSRYLSVVNNNQFNGYGSPTGGGGGAIEQETCSDQVKISGNTFSGNWSANSPAGYPSGMELYGRNISITGNTISGYAGEGIGLLSVNGADVSNNTLIDNDRDQQGNGAIKIATRSPADGLCQPGVTCDAFRDAQSVNIVNNVGNSNRAYGIHFDGNGEGSTNDIGIVGVSGNGLGAAVQIGLDQRVTLSRSITPAPQLAASASGPATIAVFPEGNYPLGLSLGTACEQYQASTCVSYGKRGIFRFGASDPNGPSNISFIEVFLGTATSSAPQKLGYGGPYLVAPFCHFLYVPPAFPISSPSMQGTLYLDGDTQSSVGNFNFGAGAAVGSGTSLTNSVCTLHAASSSSSIAGTQDLFLNLDLEFSQNGTYFMYEAAENGSGMQNTSNGSALSPWSLWGYWKVGR